MRAKNWIILTIFFLLLSSCNLMAAKEIPVPRGSETPGADAIGTAVELTTSAGMTELAGKTVATATKPPTSVPTETPSPSFTPSPTPCTPLVTANTITNVHSGPDTTYDAVGSLPAGGTANLAGRNNANTWWYIEFSGGVGGHAWVSGTAVTASCLLSDVQVVTAPTASLPKPRTSLGASINISEVSLPDLVASEMRWVPNPAKKNQSLNIRVKVSNKGTAAADDFIVVWLYDRDEPGCEWTVSGLAAGASADLDCDFTYNSEDYPDTDSFWITLQVDSEGQVTELNESKDSNTNYTRLTLRK